MKWMWALAWLGGTLLAQDRQPARVVVDPRAVCHAEASEGAQAGRKLIVGAPFFAAGTRHEGPGIWYLFRTDPVCWVEGRFTRISLGDAASNWTGILEYMNARKDAALGEFVAVDSELERARVQNPRVEFRRLQMIQNALRSYDVAHDRDYSASDREWLGANGRYFGPDAVYYPDATRYWKLYDANRDLPWAEEIAWAAVKIQPGVDECMATCVLRLIEMVQAAYWTRLPRGQHIDTVVGDAAEMAHSIVEGACYDVDSEHPMAESYSPVDGATVQRIRQSLEKVTSPAKQDLLRYLDQAEKNCADAARRPPSRDRN